MCYGVSLGMETRVASFFQPDVLLPAQYLETVRRKADLEPERMLMLAVLEDAVACFQKYVFARDSRGKNLFRDAEDWILEQESDWFFSFENICEVLRLNADYIREGLTRWKEKKLVAHSIARIHPSRTRPLELGEVFTGSRVCLQKVRSSRII